MTSTTDRASLEVIREELKAAESLRARWLTVQQYKPGSPAYGIASAAWSDGFGAGFRAALAAAPAAPAAEQQHSIPPSHWDGWALRRARQLVADMETVNHPRAQLVARIQVALVDAMLFVAPTA